METKKTPVELKKHHDTSKKVEKGKEPPESEGQKLKSRKRRSKESLDNSKVIRLLGNRSVYHVPVEDFLRVSQLIKQQQTAGNLMASVDLHRFSDQSIIAFVNFVQNKEIKSSLTYYAITELVTLAHTFQMKDLKACLEDSIIEAAKSSEADLLQTMIICDVAHVNPETEKALQSLAIDQIDKLVALPDFHKMPFHQLYQIMSSCELTVTHEMFVADVVLLWLVGQNHVNAFAPSLLSCIRTKFLSPVDRTLIIERVHQLNMPNKLVRLARNMLESSNNQRTCLDPVHMKKNWPRCGHNVNPTHFNPHSSLPLSRPNFNMKMIKTKESTGKTRPTFDPATAPKVMDLIAKDLKTSKLEQKHKSLKKKKTEEKKIEKRSESSLPPISSRKKTKSRCACIEYVKSKMSKKKCKKATSSAVFHESKSIKVRPPGTSSQKSDTKSKTSVSSKLSQSASATSLKSDKSLEKRRSQKRNKIQNAIKTSKSDTDTRSAEKEKKKGTK